MAAAAGQAVTVDMTTVAETAYVMGKGRTRPRASLFVTHSARINGSSFSFHRSGDLGPCGVALETGCVRVRSGGLGKPRSALAG